MDSQFAIGQTASPSCTSKVVRAMELLCKGRGWSMETRSETPRMLDSVRAFLRKEHQLLINGRWVAASSGETFPVEDPATQEMIARVAKGGSEDISRAVAAARHAFDKGPWQRLTP